MKRSDLCHCTLWCL